MDYIIFCVEKEQKTLHRKRLKNGGNVSGVATFVKVNFVFNLINAYGQFYIY